MSEFNPKILTAQERAKALQEREIDNPQQQQSFFSKMQKNHSIEQSNQKTHENYQRHRMNGQQERMKTDNFPSDNEIKEDQQKKSRTQTQIELQKLLSTPQKNNQLNQMNQSKSAVIHHKKNNSEFSTPNRENSNLFHSSHIYNASPPERQYNRSLPSIDNNKIRNGSSTPKSSNSHQNKVQYENNHFLPSNHKRNNSDRQVMLSKYQIYQNYQPRESRQNYYTPTNNQQTTQFNQKLHQQKRTEDEQFRKKLIQQNEKLIQMFEQMQRQHKEEISLLKFREKQTMRLIRQQQEQIDQQNRKIECRDLPPPNFFLAPLQF